MIHANKASSEEETFNPSLSVTTAEQIMERWVGPQEENETRQNPHLPRNTSGCWSCNYTFKLLNHWANGEKEKKNKKPTNLKRVRAGAKIQSSNTALVVTITCTTALQESPHQWTNSTDPEENSAGGVTFLQLKTSGHNQFPKMPSMRC